jgi:hypothetical protein
VLSLNRSTHEWADCSSESRKPTKAVRDAIGCIALTLVLVGCGTQPKPEAKPARQRLSPVQIFDLRTKCQEIVDKDQADFKIGVVGNALVADVKSHYNPITNHCYAEVVVTKNFSFVYPQTPMNYRTDTLFDAQTADILLHADEEGDKRSGMDFGADNNTSTYDKVSDQIHLLMTQEDE